MSCTAELNTTVEHPVHIRTAQPDEAEELAALSVRTFRGAFDATNDPAAMDAYVAEAFSVGRIRGELADPAGLFLLAVAEGEAAPLGYAKLRTGQTDPAVTGPRPIEIQRIYAEQTAIGRGVGAALMRTCLERAAEDGYETVWLGVWEHNPRAIRFYERWGFRPVGTHVFRLGEEDQTDVVMARDVSSLAR